MHSAVKFIVLILALCFVSPSTIQAQQPALIADVVDENPPQPLLNSERIRQRFGSYGIEVLDADQQVRVANLYSLSDGQKVTRTLAVVVFPDAIPPVILPEHELIKAGGSIGEVFKSHGWHVEKENLYFGEIEPSQAYAGVYEMMGGVPVSDLAMHAYILSVSKDAERVDYATIVEVHHPDYMSLQDLEQIYSADDNGDTSDDVLPEPVFEIVQKSLARY